MKKEVLIYQSKSGKIEFQADLKKDTIWGTLSQILIFSKRQVSYLKTHQKYL